MTQNKSALKRTLKTPSLVIFGLAYLTPMIVLAIFGVIAEASQGASSAAYALALLAMLFTAHSYGRMAKAYPVAGSAYTYVRKTINSKLGFLVGWVALLDYLFLPMVIWLIGGSYLSSQFPEVPSFLWIVAFAVLTSLLNIIGIRVADKANFALMAFQVLFLAIFAVLALVHVSGQGSGLTADPFFNSGTSFSAISAGAAIAAYSFLGFDAVTTLTEETIEPEKRMPKAIMLVALIGGAIFIAISYLAQLVSPGGTFESVDSAATDLVVKLGGAAFGAFFLAVLVIAQFASGIAAQASSSRLLYAMGRDGVLPRKVFGLLSGRFQTPYLNIIITGLVGLIAIFLDVATSTSFINFGGFIAFTMVNLSVLFYFFKQREALGLNPVSYLVLPAVGTLICAYLLSQLDEKALTLGGIWLVLGLALLAVITRGFRQQPPQMSEL